MDEWRAWVEHQRFAPELARLLVDPDFLRETSQAQLIIKVAPGAEVTALVEALHAYPKTVIEQASALLRNITQ